MSSKKYKSPDMELTIDYKGVCYVVGVDYDERSVDDSYNGDRGGEFYVFKHYSREIDPETIDIKSISSEEDYAIEPRDIDKEFYNLIIERAIEEYND
jgi:hypothetical protein